MLDRAAVRALSVWHSEFFSDSRCRIAFFLFIAGICLARAFIGLTGMRVFSHDAFALLDPAWRILNGQIPHVDFFDNLGPAAYLPTAAGLWLARGKVDGSGTTKR